MKRRLDYDGLTIFAIMAGMLLLTEILVRVLWE